MYLALFEKMPITASETRWWSSYEQVNELCSEFATLEVGIFKPFVLEPNNNRFYLFNKIISGASTNVSIINIIINLWNYYYFCDGMF